MKSPIARSDRALRLFARLLGFFFGLSFLFGLGFGREFFDPFEDGELGGVALPLVEADNASVATGAVFEERRDVLEEHFYGVFLMQARSRETAVVERAALAERDHLFGDGTRSLGLRHSGPDPFVLNQAADQVREHRVAMIAFAAKLGRAF